MRRSGVRGPLPASNLQVYSDVTGHCPGPSFGLGILLLAVADGDRLKRLISEWLHGVDLYGVSTDATKPRRQPCNFQPNCLDRQDCLHAARTRGRWRWVSPLDRWDGTPGQSAGDGTQVRGGLWGASGQARALAAKGERAR